MLSAIFYYLKYKIVLERCEFVFFKWSKKILKFFDKNGHPVKKGWPKLRFSKIKEP